MAARQLGAAALGRLADGSTRHARWVLAGWAVAAALLTFAGPRLDAVVSRDATPFLPSASPSLRTFAQMDRGFGAGAGRSMAFVVLVAPSFADNAVDQGYYRALTGRLRAGRAHVADVQDYASAPRLAASLTSRDGDATYIPVALRHPVGSPRAIEDVGWLHRTVAVGRPPGLRTFVTGDVASIANLTRIAQGSLTKVTVVSVVIIIAILLLLYRSLLLPLVPLATIGVALLTARGVVALLGEAFLPVSTYTGTFLTALVLGAGTDYTVFLISRHHEAMRAGHAPRSAVGESVRRIGPVVVASGFTVIIGSACMVLARLALFGTTGPAIAVAILVTLVVGLTFTPALLAVMGRRAAPRSERAREATRWGAVGGLVARHPARLAAASVALLAVLAAFWPGLRPSYDEQQLLPASVESSRGYAALDRHFPTGELRPDYVLVSSRHDLRDSRDLTVLDQVAATLAKLPGVTSVRGLTRPQGRVVPQGELSAQLGLVGDRLGRTGNRLHAGAAGVDRLSAGAGRLAGGADRLAAGTGRAGDAVDVFLAALRRVSTGAAGAIAATDAADAGAAQLRDAGHALAAALRDARDRTADAVDQLGVIYRALSADPVCLADPVCNTSRVGIHRIWTGERDRLVPGLSRAATAADRIGTGDGSLAGGLARLSAGLARARSGLARLAAGERQFRDRLGGLTGGAAALARGASALPAGTDRLRAQTARLSAGLARTSSYLASTAHAAQDAGVSTFFLPAGALNDPRLASARDYYLSHDGRTARFLVVTGDRRSRIDAERDAVRLALRHTPLAAAHVAVTGPSAVDDDIRHLAGADLRLVAFATLGAVFLILVLMLRSLVAPLYLLVSVVLSYAAAMGVGRLVWQDLLGDPVDFTMPLLAFVVLVAVGADYNILLMSRVREESRAATRRGVARAVAATGGVITSAGLIFAGTFIALSTSPLLGLAETGSTIAVGLLLDTFVVRSLLVPSIAALLGRANWWPGERGGRVAPSLRGMRAIVEQRVKRAAS